jgi:hypothetical protein
MITTCIQLSLVNTNTNYVRGGNENDPDNKSAAVTSPCNAKQQALDLETKIMQDTFIL